MGCRGLSCFFEVVDRVGAVVFFAGFELEIGILTKRDYRDYNSILQ